MTSKRTNYVVMALVALLGVFAIYSLFWANQTLGKKSAKLVNLRLENELAENQQTSLALTNKNIGEYKDLEKIAKAVVPQDKDQAQTVREIVKIASDSGITLSSISFPASTLGQTPPKTTPEAGETGSTQNQTAAPPVTQVKPVQGISGVYVMEITVQQDQSKPITYNQLIGFLSRLENNRRTAQVSGVTVQPNPGDRSKLSFKLTVNAYIKPAKP
jgi:type II secretory pathway pseudopilin PulG